MPIEIVEDAEFAPKPRVPSGKPRAPRKRSEEQKEWDEAFMNSLPRGIFSVQVTPEEAEDARKRAVSAARLNGRALTEGAARPGRQEGTVVLTWKIRVPKKRPEKPSKPAE